MNSKVVLGLNCSHDAAAAIAIDNVLVAAISEERLTRRKHHDGFPYLSIDYCLRQAGLDRRSAKIETVVINQLPPATYERHVYKHLYPAEVKRLIVNPSHHYLHACYAELMTDERPLVILVADGSGYSYAEHHRRGSPLLGPEPPNTDMWESLSAYLVESDGTTTLLLKDWGEWHDYNALRFPSLGHMYGHAAQHVFGSWTHAGKLMGLASFGNPKALSTREVVSLSPAGLTVDTDWLSETPPIVARHNLDCQPLACNIAAKAQAELERGMMHICRLLREKAQCETICLTGGVALNSVFNGALANSGLFRRVVVSPASGDAGTAIGAAAFGCKQNSVRMRLHTDPEFTGRIYNNDEIAAALRQCSEIETSEIYDPVDAAVRDIMDGRIIGWFEGSSEFGPRALGHRSILADPRDPTMKDRLNSRVKFRESFRPYAAAVLYEKCAEWFEQGLESPHMLMVANIRPENLHLIPAVAHVDRSCRLQTLGRDYPGSLRSIVERFADLTGVPLVLNTSLNTHGEPMAETPGDAIDCLARSGLDALYVGPYRVVRNTSFPSERVWASYPQAASSCYVAANLQAGDAVTKVAECLVRQGNRDIKVSKDEFELMLRVTGRKPVADIAAEMPHMSHEATVAAVQSLCDRGLLRLREAEQGTAMAAGVSECGVPAGV